MKRLIPFPDSLKKISKHRQFLYGFAALWIMFYHMGTKVPNRGIWTPVYFFQATGAGGVEVFLLLTGFGLYRSMQKDARLSVFYGKRFMRVFLPSFVALAIINVFSSQRLVGYLGSITFFGQWLGADSVWFVAFILTMYLIYPLVFALTKKKRRVLYAMAILSLGLSFMVEPFFNGSRNDLMRMISRFPVFLISCAIAPLFEENRPLPKYMLPCLIIITIPLMWFFKKMANSGYMYSFRAIAYFFYSIALVIAVSSIAELLSKKAAGCMLYRFFAFCGQVSLEIYLLFGRFRGLFAEMPGFNAHSCGGLKLDIAAAICTLILAVPLQNIVQSLIKSFEGVRIPAPEKD